MMQQPRFLKTVEIFASVQGEGLRQGEPTIFVRFSGCNLSCYFCDTKKAWEGGKKMTTDQILGEITIIRERYPADWICITGGEPLLQDLGLLLNELKQKKMYIQVETNGTIYKTLPVDWYTVSPKPEKYGFKPEYIKKAREIKIIVTKELKFGVIRELRNKFPLQTPVLLQPQSTRKWSMEQGVKLLKQATEAGLKNIRLSVQLHKIFGMR